MKTQRRASAAAVALLLGGAGIAMGATPAQAAVVDVQYKCKTPIGDKEAVSPIDIKGVKEGGGYKLTMSFQKGVSSSPIELGAGAMTPSAEIVLGGAEQGKVAVQGAPNAEPIPANTPIKINDLTGIYTPKKSGKVTFTAGVLLIKALGTTTTCTPGNNPGPSLELDVTAGGSSPSPSSPPPTSKPPTSPPPTSKPPTTPPPTTAPPTSPAPSPTGGGQTDFPGQPVDVTFDCGTFMPNGPLNGKVTISAKKNGGSYDLTAATAKGVMNSPADLPAGALQPALDIKLGGADSGIVKVSGPGNPEPIKAGTPVSLSDMKGTYKPGKTGKTTLTPDKLTINVVMAPGAAPIVVPCAATKSAVSLTLDTAAQPGGSGTSGGSTSGGTSGSTSGGLAQTGASDDGGIKALALVAGTVMLLGAAVFTFTPWRRLRGQR
ncbi:MULTISPECIES: hypothetical protein [unclassified Streptomyces]|uniref:hypothetical protein n=1 Tax=unclassified Streptomyces TaxID=2593676 RepID=UPI00202EBCBA|nr:MULTISPECIES: hypothetical protein [unclassified Streptomyces]MCM1964780.1 hypothetical protein [Streptomyces sp. G1]MCX5124869.1 hypothetical protein [Streptomyces sp. NBC_00347]MCX5298051.1 hypothetical protein [Streptomyces sp. NBC_00193]